MRLLAFLAAASLFLIGPAGAAPAEDSAADAPVPVRVIVAAPSPKAGQIHATGTLLFKREITLGFKTPGVVSSFAVDAGDPAKAGDVLVRLDPADVGARDRDALALLENAERDLARAKELAAKGFASQARVDTAQMAVDRARASRAASANDAAKAEIRAPSDGVVLSRLAEPNEVVAAGTPIILFGDASGGLVLVTPLSDRQIVRVRGGDQAVVRFADLPPVKAVVSRIAAKADQRTGAFDVELKIGETPPGLRSGLVGEANIVPALRDGSANFVAVPGNAVLEGRGDQAAIYVVDSQGRAQRRSVRVAGFVDDMILVGEGLKSGEKVVTEGAAYLRNGQKVSIVADAPSS